MNKWFSKSPTEEGYYWLVKEEWTNSEYNGTSIPELIGVYFNEHGAIETRKVGDYSEYEFIPVRHDPLVYFLKFDTFDKITTKKIQLWLMKIDMPEFNRE